MLSKTEEQLMEHIWKAQIVYLKDLIDAFPDPKPASTTLATLLKRMQEKGFVAYELHGNSRAYYALVNKTDYFSKQIKGIIQQFFGNSALQFASFFTQASNLSQQELEQLRTMVDEQIALKESE